MSPLTTPQRVRDRVGLAEADVADAVLEGYIADQQAFVEAAVRGPLREGSAVFALARSVVTDLAALKAVVRLMGGTAAGLEYRIGKLDVRKRTALEARLRAAAELRQQAADGLEALRKQRMARRFVAIRGGP